MEEMRFIKFNPKQDNEELSKEFIRYFESNMIVPILGSGFTVGEATAHGEVVPSGLAMKKHMLSKIFESESLKSEEKEYLKSQDFSTVSSYYEKTVEENDRRNYIKTRLSKVNLPEGKKKFITIPFKTIYTLNTDDAIEFNSENIEVILPNKSLLDEDTLGEFRNEGKTILFKIHGDVQEYLKYKEPFIFNKEQYVSSISKNKNVLTQLATDLMSNCAIFIGCSLDDEIDLMYAALGMSYGKQSLKHTYYVTHKELNKIEEHKLTNFNIDTIIKLESDKDYLKFYDFVKIQYEKTVEKKDVTLALNPKIIFDKSDKESFYNDISYLMQTYHIYRYYRKKEIHLPSFFISRDVIKNNFKKIQQNNIIVLYGHRFSGKSYALIDLYNKFARDNRVFIPQKTHIDYEKLIDIIKNSRNTVFFIDSNNIGRLVVDFILENKKLILENNIKLIMTLTSSEKDNLFILQNLMDLPDSEEFISRIYIDNIFSKNETDSLNSLIDRTLIGKFDYSSRDNKVTILDNIYKRIDLLDENDFDISGSIINKNLQEGDIQDRVMDLLILLAIHNSSITIKNIEKFELGGSVTQIERKFQPIVQFAFIEEIEKNVFDTSSQKFLCNSNVWLLKELQRLSMDSQYHEKIVGAYKRIITSIIIANSQNKPKQRNEIAKYIKFDEINDIFSNSAGGARKLIDKIYESLFGLLNDNFQYFHQRAKSLSWRDGDIDSLNNALRFIKKAKNDIEVYYSSSYKEKPAYKHVCYTQAVIYVKIAKHNHFDDIQKNNMAIKAITDAFYDNENINYIESDNERGVPNDIVGFIKKVHYSRKFSEDNRDKLNNLFNRLISNINTSFNHRRYSKKRNHRS